MQIIINMATRTYYQDILRSGRVVSGSPSSRMRERTRSAMGRDGASLGKVIGSERLCVMVQVNFNPIDKKIFLNGMFGLFEMLILI